jgi:membrane-associated protein
MTITGYCLGENEWVKGNLEKIVIGLILVTTLPVLYKMIFAKKRA